MRHWSAVRDPGRSSTSKAPVQNFRYRGEPSDLVASIALANSGPLQIELIQQRNDAPSMYRDFLEAGHEGCSTSLTGRRGFDADLERLGAAGYEIGQSGEAGGRTGGSSTWIRRRTRGRWWNFRDQRHKGGSSR